MTDDNKPLRKPPRKVTSPEMVVPAPMRLPISFVDVGFLSNTVDLLRLQVERLLRGWLRLTSGHHADQH